MMFTSTYANMSLGLLASTARPSAGVELYLIRIPTNIASLLQQCFIEADCSIDPLCSLCYSDLYIIEQD